MLGMGVPSPPLPDTTSQRARSTLRHTVTPMPMLQKCRTQLVPLRLGSSATISNAQYIGWRCTTLNIRWSAQPPPNNQHRKRAAQSSTLDGDAPHSTSDGAQSQAEETDHAIHKLCWSTITSDRRLITISLITRSWLQWVLYDLLKFKASHRCRTNPLHPTAHVLL